MNTKPFEDFICDISKILIQFKEEDDSTVTSLNNSLLRLRVLGWLKVLPTELGDSRRTLHMIYNSLPGSPKSNEFLPFSVLQGFIDVLSIQKNFMQATQNYYQFKPINELSSVFEEITNQMNSIEKVIAKQQKYICDHIIDFKNNSNADWIDYNIKANENLEYWDSLKSERDIIKKRLIKKPILNRVKL